MKKIVFAAAMSILAVSVAQASIFGGSSVNDKNMPSAANVTVQQAAPAAKAVANTNKGNMNIARNNANKATAPAAVNAQQPATQGANPVKQVG